MKKSIKDKMILAGYTVCVMILLWILASYIDVIAHNMSTCIYADWNFFKMVFMK